MDLHALIRFPRTARSVVWRIRDNGEQPGREKPVSADGRGADQPNQGRNCGCLSLGPLTRSGLRALAGGYPGSPRAASERFDCKQPRDRLSGRRIRRHRENVAETLIWHGTVRARSQGWASELLRPRNAPAHRVEEPSDTEKRRPGPQWSSLGLSPGPYETVDERPSVPLKLAIPTRLRVQGY